MNTAEFLTAAIPDAIRTGNHSDENLVFQAIVSALKPYHENSDSWDRTVAKRIHESLTAFMAVSLSAHLEEEKRAWDALKAQASLAPKPHEVSASAFDRAQSEDAYNDAMEGALAILPSLNADERAHVHKAIKGYHARAHTPVKPGHVHVAPLAKAQESEWNREYRERELKRAFNAMEERVNEARQRNYVLPIADIESMMLVPERTPGDEAHNAAVHAEAARLHGAQS